MAFETTKAYRRRMAEDSMGKIPWRDILSGSMIDVGAGPDKHPGESVVSFDLSGADVNGDAQHLSNHFKPGSVDVIHASQCAEHLPDPAAAVHDWLKVLRKNGCIVATTPCWELYERMTWPSRYNPDHRSTWSLWQKGSPAPIHCKLPEWLRQFNCTIIVCRLVDTNFNYSLGSDVDQTWKLEDGVECWLEFCLMKRA